MLGDMWLYALNCMHLLSDCKEGTRLVIYENFAFFSIILNTLADTTSADSDGQIYFVLFHSFVLLAVHVFKII
jgi:hypothetical protein